MSYFKQMPTIDRDQSRTLLAVQEFDRLIKNFPRSEYIPQAKANRDEGLKNLVRHEFYRRGILLQTGKLPGGLGAF